MCVRGDRPIEYDDRQFDYPMNSLPPTLEKMKNNEQSLQNRTLILTEILTDCGRSEKHTDFNRNFD